MTKFLPDSIITMKDFVKEDSILLRKQTEEVTTPLNQEDRSTLLAMLQYLKNSQDPTLAKNISFALELGCLQIK